MLKLILLSTFEAKCVDLIQDILKKIALLHQN